MVADYTEEEIKKAHEILFNEGVKMRYQVAGKEYVDAALKKRSDPFAGAMQDVRITNISSHILPTNRPTNRLFFQFVTESCWGSIWTRPGLELKTRSFLNIAMLCCQNRGTELATHVKGALNNGGSEEEIREVILQAACYCGMPAGIEGFRVASKAVEEWKAERAKKEEK
jgi:4-carboxymuconolactone decarboxylase